MSYADYAEAKCVECGRENNDIWTAFDRKQPCPHCGYDPYAKLATCCIPDCGRLILGSSPLPVCHDCGVKVASIYLHDAEMYDAITQQRERFFAPLRDARRNGRLDTSVVYYVRLAEDRIKIGFTSKIDARLQGLRVRRTAVLAVEPGGRELEGQRHRQFRADRISGRLEDFRPSETLLAWIEQVREEHGLPWLERPDTHTVTVRRAG